MDVLVNKSKLSVHIPRKANGYVTTNGTLHSAEHVAMRILSVYHTGTTALSKSVNLRPFSKYIPKLIITINCKNGCIAPLLRVPTVH
jgi:hypothetical protein